MILFPDITRKNGRALGYNTLTSIKKKGGKLFFHNLRDMDHKNNIEHYLDDEFVIEDAQEVYMYDSPFGYKNLVSHIMLEFVFTDKKNKESKRLVLSVEARRKQSEGYSFWKGLFWQFGLIYVRGAPRDVLFLRKKRKEKMYRYKLQFTPYEVQQGLLYFVKRSNSLIKHPEYYHVFNNNCVINLRNAFSLKGKMRPKFKLKIVPGSGVAEYMYELGYLDTSLPFEKLKKKSLYNNTD